MPRFEPELRAGSITHLLALDRAGTLTPDHIRAVADAHACHPRTVIRWMERARDHHGAYQRKQRPRAELTPAMDDELILWCGNIAAAHRSLKQRDGTTMSYAAFHRLVTRSHPPSYLAGLRQGEKGRRAYDLFGTQRERGRRNDVWEADHKEADVWVNVDGIPRKPWVTWFVNCSNTGICG
ncbi:recombinase, partial [Streptomyces violascens]